MMLTSRNKLILGFAFLALLLGGVLLWVTYFSTGASEDKNILWKQATDSNGVSFQYPEKLSTK